MIVTPHVSVLSDPVVKSREVVIRERVRRNAAGDKQLSVVDMKRRY